MRWLVEWRQRVSMPVFLLAAGFNVAIIFFAIGWTELARVTFANILQFVTHYFGWYYILIVSVFLVFVVWLSLSRHGRIRLGPPGSEPEFSYAAWIAMLFAAGMGMGLVYWGVAEPIRHYMDPPRAAPQSAEAVREAMRFAFFHWGFHAWSIYIVFALGLAFYHFRHGLPLAPRSLLYPLIGDRIHGWIGHVVDAFCVVGTLLGVATSLGLGAMQINAGLSGLTGIASSTGNQIAIVAVITLVATASTVSGVARGIRLLSLVNIALMACLLLFVFLAGPTLFQVELFITSLGDYLQNVIETSLWIDVGEGVSWQTEWTRFYWGWWISWSPFVGIFVARISRGRTIREFVTCVFLIPSITNFVWFSVFGGTALHNELTTGASIAAGVMRDSAMSLYLLLATLPLAAVTQWLGIALIVIFFITSSDSGSFVDDMVTCGGDPNPPVANRVFWGLSEGAAAASLLLAGGLGALQTASVSAALPQSLLLILACFGLARALNSEGDQPGGIRPVGDMQQKSNRE
ncbi:MAG: BCCT family transporter [Halioglobus sp.]|jgi:choline/glycine/proline betaine transport protein